MIRMLAVVLTLTGLLLSACGQDAPPKAQPQPAAKPAAAAPPAAAPLPAAQVNPAPPASPAPPAAPAVPAPASPPLAAKPAAPAGPVKPEARKITVPDSFTLPASQGKVTFPHLVHARLFPCATCHGDGTPGKIGLDKETAHALCRDCHKAKGNGPTACGGCHQK